MRQPLRGLFLATTVVLLAAGLAGCRRASQTDGRTYRHNGMNFSVAVPEGWTHEELPGDLLVELDGPAGEENRRAVAHVFSRREIHEVELGDATSGVVHELLEVMKQQLRFELGEESPPAVGPAEVGDLPADAKAVRVARTTHEGPVEVSQELIVVARGKQVWALMLSVPVADREASLAALDEIRSSFRVW